MIVNFRPVLLKVAFRTNRSKSTSWKQKLRDLRVSLFLVKYVIIIKLYKNVFFYCRFLELENSMIFWFGHFQLEFEAETLQFCSTHGDCKSSKYEGQTPSGSGRTRKSWYSQVPRNDSKKKTFLYLIFGDFQWVLCLKSVSKRILDRRSSFFRSFGEIRCIL